MNTFSSLYNGVLVTIDVISEKDLNYDIIKSSLIDNEIKFKEDSSVTIVKVLQVECCNQAINKKDSHQNNKKKRKQFKNYDKLQFKNHRNMVENPIIDIGDIQGHLSINAVEKVTLRKIVFIMKNH